MLASLMLNNVVLNSFIVASYLSVVPSAPYFLDLGAFFCLIISKHQKSWAFQDYGK